MRRLSEWKLLDRFPELTKSDRSMAEINDKLDNPLICSVRE